MYSTMARVTLTSRDVGSAGSANVASTGAVAVAVLNGASTAEALETGSDLGASLSVVTAVLGVATHRGRVVALLDLSPEEIGPMTVLGLHEQSVHGTATGAHVREATGLHERQPGLSRVLKFVLNVASDRQVLRLSQPERLRRSRHRSRGRSDKDRSVSENRERVQRSQGVTCDVVSLTGSEVVAVYYPPLRTRDPDLRAILEIHGSDLYGGQACWALGLTPQVGRSQEVCRPVTVTSRVTALGVMAWSATAR